MLGPGPADTRPRRSGSALPGSRHIPGLGAPRPRGLPLSPVGRSGRRAPVSRRPSVWGRNGPVPACWGSRHVQLCARWAPRYPGACPCRPLPGPHEKVKRCRSPGASLHDELAEVTAAGGEQKPCVLVHRWERLRLEVLAVWGQGNAVTSAAGLRFHQPSTSPEVRSSSDVIARLPWLPAARPGVVGFVSPLRCLGMSSHAVLILSARMQAVCMWGSTFKSCSS